MNIEHYEFSPLTETVKNIAHEAMFTTLEAKKYTPSKLYEWTETVANKIIDRLRELAPFFKYIVNVCFIEKTGAGVYSETIAYWDTKTDGFVAVKYENESLICICNVIGVAI